MFLPMNIQQGKRSESVDLLIEAKIAPSKRQAREDVSNGAISYQWRKSDRT